MSSTGEPSDTIDRLRERAARTSGPLFVELEQLRDRADLPAAAAQLIRTGTEDERVIAILALREAADRGAEAAEPVLLALRDPSARVRIVAARALGVIQWPGARSALETSTQDHDPHVRKQALLGLLELDAAAGIRRVGDALGKDRDTREPALAALEAAKLDDLPDQLVALIDDPDVATRLRALGIMSFSSSSSGEPLLRALRDASPEVRLAAVDALSRRAQAVPTDALQALFSDPDPRVRQRTVQLVARVGGSRHLQTLDLLPADMPAMAAMAIAALGGASAIPRLRAMLARSTSEIDRQLIWVAISRIGERLPDEDLGTELLREGLGDAGASVRRAVIDAAVWLAPHNAALVEEHLRREPDSRVRAAGMRSLARLLGSAAAPGLRRGLADQAEDVRREALEALGYVGTSSDRVFIERAAAISPLEQLARWQALVRLSHGQAALPEATRALADPARTGRLSTHWYEPGGDVSVTFSRAGMMIVFHDDDRMGEVGSFDVIDEGHARIGDRRCTLRVARLRIHEPASSTWGYAAEIKPDPWSSEPRRLLETVAWQDDGALVRP